MQVSELRRFEISKRRDSAIRTDVTVTLIASARKYQQLCMSKKRFVYCMKQNKLFSTQETSGTSTQHLRW